MALDLDNPRKPATLGRGPLPESIKTRFPTDTGMSAKADALADKFGDDATQDQLRMWITGRLREQGGKVNTGSEDVNEALLDYGNKRNINWNDVLRSRKVGVPHQLTNDTIPVKHYDVTTMSDTSYVEKGEYAWSNLDTWNASWGCSSRWGMIDERCDLCVEREKSKRHIEATRRAQQSYLAHQRQIKEAMERIGVTVRDATERFAETIRGLDTVERQTQLDEPRGS